MAGPKALGPTALAPRAAPRAAGPVVAGGNWVNALAGESLCELAQRFGHFDCALVRARDENKVLLGKPLLAGDAVFVPDLPVPPQVSVASNNSVTCQQKAPWIRPQIRFVRRTPGAPPQIVAVTELNITNFPISKSGDDGDDTFPSTKVKDFDPAGDADPDAFKIEVTDTNPVPLGSSVSLVPLKPVYAAGNVSGHVDFPVKDVNLRCLASAKVTADPANPQVFRTYYLRAVSDEASRTGRKDQAVVLTDDYLASQEMEILDQNVAAFYPYDRCPGPVGQKCGVAATLPLNRGRALTASVKILRLAPGGPGVVTEAQAKKQFGTYLRQHWAQAQIRFNIQSLTTVDPPSEMFTVGDWRDPAEADQPAHLDNSALAAAKPAFKLQIDGADAGVVSVDIAPGDTPAMTAAKLAAAIPVACPQVQVRSTSRNPRALNRAHPSVDILLQPAAGAGRVTISEEPASTQDPRQKVRPVKVDLVSMHMPGEPDYRYMYHIGIAEHRLLVKSLDSGNPAVVDVLIVENMQGCLGYAIGRLRSLPADKQPVPEMQNSILLVKSSSMGGKKEACLASHEFGHVLTDLPTHSLRLEQLMEQNPGKDNVRSHIFANDPTRNNWEDFVVVPDVTVFIQASGMPLTIALRKNASSQILDPLDLTVLGDGAAPCTTHIRQADSSIVEHQVTKAKLDDPAANDLKAYSGTEVFHDPFTRRLNAVAHILSVSGDLLT